MRFNPLSGTFEYSEGKIKKVINKTLSNGVSGLVRVIAGSNISVQQNGNDFTVSSTGVTTSPGGSDTQVQFNDGGSFGGDGGFTWDKTNDILTVGVDSGTIQGGSFSGALSLLGGAPSSDTAAGGNVIVAGSDGGATSGQGGVISITAGSAQAGDSSGGIVGITAGAQSGAGHQGSVYIRTPNSGAIVELGSFGGDYPSDTLGIKSNASNGFAILNTSLLTSDETFKFPLESGTFATQNFAIAMALALG